MVITKQALSNGNITGRTNTTFTTIEYNHLNLPKKFIGAGANLIENTYDASGLKWQTTQLGAYAYYFGNVEYNGSTPNNHAGGRVVSTGPGTWEYHYYLKDHLDHTRAVVKG